MIIKVINGNPEIIADVSPVPSWKAKENELGYVQDKPQALIDLHAKYPNGLPPDFPGVSSDSKVNSLTITNPTFIQENNRWKTSLELEDYDITDMKHILSYRIIDDDNNLYYPSISTFFTTDGISVIDLTFGATQPIIHYIHITYERV